MTIIDPEKGLSIYSAAQQAIQTAELEEECVTLRFNDIEIAVSPQSYVHDICTIYSLHCGIRRFNAGIVSPTIR